MKYTNLLFLLTGADVVPVRVIRGLFFMDAGLDDISPLGHLKVVLVLQMLRESTDESRWLHITHGHLHPLVRHLCRGPNHSISCGISVSITSSAYGSVSYCNTCIRSTTSISTTSSNRSSMRVSGLLRNGVSGGSNINILMREETGM